MDYSYQQATSSQQASSFSSQQGIHEHRWQSPITKKPMFAIEFWNVFDRAKKSIERTNNAMEKAHSHFAV